MPLPARKYLFVIALLLCASLALDAAQKKSSTPTKKAEPAAAEPAGKPIAVHDFSAEGVQVALMEVTRTAPDVVTVKWEYRNTTAKEQELAADAKGWSDPYRLSWDTYLLADDGKTKLPLMKDGKGIPVAAVHGRAAQHSIMVLPNKTLKTWAKYSAPSSNKKVTVVISGSEPFEGVEVKEPEQKPGN
ncbi:MAG TPA: hypothetical protein VIJ01_08820 [Candidatus Angelobacter sp.]|jgi:hypothetical protein